MSPAMTTPVIPEDVEDTTVSEVQGTSTTGKLEETTRSYEDMVSEESRDKMEREEKWGRKKIDGEKKGDRWKTKKDSWTAKDVEDALSLDLFEKEAKRNEVKEAWKEENKLKEDSEGTQSEESLDREKLKSINEDERDFGKSNKETDTFEASQASKDDYYAHPKNHRTKWSEVRYPSAFDRSPAWNQNPKRNSNSAMPGLVSKPEDNSVKTLSDYVQAIFDSMKSAEETTTAKTEELEVTTIQVPSDTEFTFSSVGDEERSTMKEADSRVTTQATVMKDEKATKDAETFVKETTQTESTSIDPEEATTLERVTTTPEGVTSSPTELPATDLPTTITASPDSSVSTTATSNATESMLGKVLRTSTTTKVSHMTEICYRGRCVMTRPSQDDRFR